MILPILSIANTYGYSTRKISKYLENLDRGVVAIRAGSTTSFISWRYLITDDDNIAFNVYRRDEDNNVVKLNTEPIESVTYFYDKTHDKTKTYKYFVGSIVNQKEVENSTEFVLQANTADIPCIRIPIKNGTRFRIVWFGDLNGDGKLDFVLARDAEDYQTIEAYLHDGTYLWEINLGHNSLNKDNIEPGATTVNVGQIDGINIFDLNGDGKGEVYIRIANNVTFGDGYVFTHENDLDQWIACVDGMTGKLLHTAPIPGWAKQYGPMSTQFGVGWFDLERPSLAVVMKNRDDRRRFHMMNAIYGFNSTGGFELRWYFTPDSDPSYICPEGHHFRIADVDYDGIDEIHNIGFTMNGNGTLRYDLGKQKIVHGDRFYVAKFNKNDTTMSGYGIQQNNPDLIYEYFYNASTGEIKWIHYGPEVHDVGRGNAADFDPTHDGFEVFAFSGMYNAKTNELVAENAADTLWPSNNVFWDGTLITACYNRGYLDKWDYTKNRGFRLYTAYADFQKKYGQYPLEDAGGHYPLFHGDIIGDWREEFVMAASNWSEIVIFTTNLDTGIKLTTLWHDPGMRASMTINGYKQSHMPLEYLGAETIPAEHRQNLKKYHKLRADKEIIIPTEKPATPESSTSNAATEQPTATPIETSDSKSGVSKKAAAVVVPIVLILIVGAGAVAGYIYWRRSKNADDSDSVAATTLIV